MATIQETTRPPRRLDDVPGWFPVLDQMLFDWFLTRQEAGGTRGDLLEVGAEATKSYSALTRARFEENHLSFHDELPRVLQGPGSVVPEEVEAASCRFVHIERLAPVRACARRHRRGA